MKRVILYAVLSLSVFFSNTCVASWKNVYQDVKDTYVGSIKIQDLASASLKGLNNIDKDLTVGSGVESITL